MSGPTFEPERVYWLDCPAPAFLPEIVADLRYQDGTLEFQASERPQALVAAYLGPADGGEQFKDAAGRVHTVRPLDVATFDRVFRARVHAPPRFDTEAALTEFYLQLLRSDPY